MKKYRLRLIVYACVLFVLLSILGLSCFNSWRLIRENKKNKQDLETLYNELLENEEKLESEVVKLQDPEYVAKYAREKYLYTKEGEIIIDMTNN